MILAPHQDDELILCGSFLKELNEMADVYVVFSTNGNYEKNVHSVRLEEAIKVCSLFGISEENIIFLGYANEYDDQGPHIYNAKEDEVVCSKYGINETYGLENHPEYCFAKNGNHHLYTRTNMKNDLLSVVEDIMPDVIFATDLEIHPDHKCNSLLLDEVIGEILKKTSAYSPVILKKPGYNTSWLTEDDYSDINNPASKLRRSVVRTNGHRSMSDNPYIRWEERIRIPVGKSVRTKDNILLKALKLYSSQNAVDHYSMMNNSDVVFWQRRTDSLSYRARIETSSGEPEFINDFKIADSTNIKRSDTDSWYADASVWRPEYSDKVRKIDFYLEKREKISDIFIYQEFYPESVITKSRIVIDDITQINVGKLKNDGMTKIHFDEIFAEKVSFIIDEISDESVMPGITEIEIYKSQKPYPVYAKLMIRNNFVYDYYVSQEEKIKLQVYEYQSDGSVCTKSLEDYDIETTYGLPGADVSISESRLTGNILAPLEVKITNKNNPQIGDAIVLHPLENLKNTDFKNTVKNLIRYPSKCIPKNVINEDSGIYYGKAADILASLSYGDYRENMGRYVKDFLRGYICDDRKEDYRTKKKVFFIGTPDHGNIGDHAITMASYIYLKDNLGDYEIEEIAIMEFARKLPYLKKNIKKDDLIILQGGGNMGNVYWRNERIRREVIKHFPYNKKVIFPETIYYEKSEEGQSDFRVSQKIYGNANTYLFAREEKSYEIMKEAYPKCKVFLVPDIVCYLAPYAVSERSGKIGLCLRSDMEKSADSTVTDRIITLLDERSEDYIYLDMMNKSGGKITKHNRNKIVESKIREIAGFKYIITDRLHGMILSYITGTPCIVLGNYNYKVQSFYETWFKDIDYIRFVYDVDRIDEEITLVNGLSGCKAEKLSFDSLSDIMEEWK